MMQLNCAPTLIIGLGTTGVRLTNMLHDVFGESTNVDFLAIDSSNAEDVHRKAIEKQQLSLNYTFHFLEMPNTYSRDLDSDKYDYLVNDLDIKGVGANRERIIARYIFDKDFSKDDSLENYFLSRFVKHMNPQQNTRGFVWILNSLGGGTGSGLIPFISMYIKYVAETSIVAANPQYKFMLNGIGIYSKPAGITFESISKKNDLPYLATNSFAAMRELNKILWPDKTKNQKYISLYNTTYNHLNVADNVFHKYFLWGLNDSDGYSQSNYYATEYAKVVNVLCHLLEKNENDPVLNDNNPIMGSFWSSEICVDCASLNEYISLRKSIIENGSKLDELGLKVDNEVYSKVEKRFLKEKKSDEKEEFLKEDELKRLNILHEFLQSLLDKSSGILGKIALPKKAIERDKNSIGLLIEINSLENGLQNNKVLIEEIASKLKKGGNVGITTFLPLNEKGLENIDAKLKQNFDNVSGINDEAEVEIKSNDDFSYNTFSSLLEEELVDAGLLRKALDEAHKKINLEASITQYLDDDLSGLRETNNTFLVHNDSDSIDGFLNNTAGKWNIESNMWVDPCKMVVVAYRQGLDFLGMTFYRHMRAAYREGKFSKKDKRYNTVGPGRLFAYPEFFTNDPRVMNSYPKFFDESQPISDIDFDKYWPDCDDESIKDKLQGNASVEEDLDF